MRKRIAAILTSVLLTAVTAASLMACGNSGEKITEQTTDGEPHVTLVYAEVNPEDSIAGQIAREFKKEAEKWSDGSLTIDIHYNGKLGYEDEVLDSMMKEEDKIQISRISTFTLNSLGAEDSSLLSLPYTFVNRDHFWTFAFSQLASEMLEEDSANLPVEGLFFGEEGYRHFFTKQKINGYRDFEGMKLRVSNDPIMEDMIKSLGGIPVTVSFGDIYAAIRSGEVDGAEQPIINYRVNAFPEVSQNMYLDGHTLGILEVVITDIAWERLTENQQKAIHRASKRAQMANRSEVEIQEEQIRAELIRDNVNLEKAYTEDINGMKALWKPVIQKYTVDKSEHLADLYQQILDMKEQPLS